MKGTCLFIILLGIMCHFYHSKEEFPAFGSFKTNLVDQKWNGWPSSSSRGPGDSSTFWVAWSRVGPSSRRASSNWIRKRTTRI